MLPRSRGSTAASSALLANPIQDDYEIGVQSATAGPENIWRVYEGYSKKDRKEVSIFIFDKRSVEILHKPRRKETITETMRNGTRELGRFSHPKILHVYRVEECEDSLTFVSEPVLGSLANVLAYKEQSVNISAQNTSTPNYRKAFVKEYDFMPIEIKYGLLQIIEALSYLHQQCKIIHRNICPTSIVITKKGTWKLFGFEFIERTSEYNYLKATIPVQPWKSSVSKLNQPSLDYTPPEVQRKKVAGYYSDIYSLGMTICAIFNQGRPLIQAMHSTTAYHKQEENLKEHMLAVASNIPAALQEVVKRLFDEPGRRPSTDIILRIDYFRDAAVHDLQFLDTIKMTNVKDKEIFYTKTLINDMRFIPKKLWLQHVWPSLLDELDSKEGISAILQPVFYIIQHCDPEEYERVIFPAFRHFFANPKSIMGTVTLLENLHIILEKTPTQYIESDVLCMLYKAFKNTTIQVQKAAFIAVANVTSYIHDDAIKNIVLPNLLQAFSKEHSAEPVILINVIPHILHRLKKENIIDDILPLLCNRELVHLQDPDILVRVINIYRMMLKEREMGIPINWMANRAMPSLLPQTVNPNLNHEQFNMLFELLQNMLDLIKWSQRNRFSRDNLSLSSPERYRPSHLQSSASNIPNVRVEQRKTFSAENMARKNSNCSISMTASAENMARKNSMASALGSWFTSSTGSDKNLLKVAANAYSTRRLSDNTLMMPKIRLGPSTASSPGGTPGGGPPIRRHSSIGPQERRGSNINLSPPTGLPMASTSAPYLFGGNSLRGSRRTSTSSTTSQPGSGILHQVTNSMVRLPPICLNLSGPPPQPPPTLSPLLQLPGQPSH